jgi:hypothetical protein
LIPIPAAEAGNFDQWGVMTHLDGGVRPGLKVDAHWVRSDKQLGRQRRIHTWGPSFGGSVHPATNFNTFVDLGTSWRTHQDADFFTDWGGSVGVLRSTYLIPTITVEDTGQHSVVPLAGQTHLRWSGSFGMGRSWPSNPWVANWFIRSELSFVAPYNAGLVPFVALQAGVDLATGGDE